MKQKIVAGLLSLAVAMVGMGTASAGATAIHARATKVKGIVTENAVPVKGAAVTVTCNGNVRTDTTDVHGAYSVLFPATHSIHGGNPCPVGDTAKVMAQKGGRSGIASKTIHSHDCQFNLAVVNVSIPEYGLIGALAAGGAGFSLIAVVRRRQQRQA